MFYKYNYTLIIINFTKFVIHDIITMILIITTGSSQTLRVHSRQASVDITITQTIRASFSQKTSFPVSSSFSSQVLPTSLTGVPETTNSSCVCSK